MSKRTTPQEAADVTSAKKEKGPATTPGTPIEIAPGVFTTRAQVTKAAKELIKERLVQVAWDPHFALTDDQVTATATFVYDELQKKGIDADSDGLRLRSLILVSVRAHAKRRRNQTLTQEAQARAAERKKAGIEKSRAGMIKKGARKERARGDHAHGKLDEREELPTLTVKSTQRQEVRQITVITKKTRARAFHYPADLNVPGTDR